MSQAPSPVPETSRSVPAVASPTSRSQASSVRFAGDAPGGYGDQPPPQYVTPRAELSLPNFREADADAEGGCCPNPWTRNPNLTPRGPNRSGTRQRLLTLEPFCAILPSPIPATRYPIPETRDPKRTVPELFRTISRTFARRTAATGRGGGTRRYTQTLKPETQNPKPETRNPQPKFEIRNPETSA